ncbi:MAG: hypothetical protein ABIQ61_12620 [Ornithinibacter sp.]
MTRVARRTIMAGTVGAVASLTTTTSLAVAGTKSTDLMRRSRFTPQVGSTFTMSSDAGRRSVTLTSVDDLGPGSRAGAEGQFAAAFSGAGLSDGMYSFSRKGFVATTLFVVADPSGRGSVATVNRP